MNNRILKDLEKIAKLFELNDIDIPVKKLKPGWTYKQEEDLISSVKKLKPGWTYLISSYELF